MPELPEVQTIVTILGSRLPGAVIVAVRVARADIVAPSGVNLAKHLVGHRIASVQRRGKRIVFALDDGNRFYVHLGMSGRLTLEAPDAPVEPHTHAVFDCALPVVATDGALNLRFRDPRRFGGIWWLGHETGEDPRMGPEPLGLRTGQLATRLARTRRAIKAALLDQSLIAGLGNIYADESLFAAGIHPLLPASALSQDQVRRLNRAIKRTLRRAIDHRGSTLRDYRDASGAEGGFQKLHRVYGRESLPCPVCRTPIQRIVLGGRSAHFCPRCQSA